MKGIKRRNKRGGAAELWVHSCSIAAALHLVDAAYRGEYSIERYNGVHVAHIGALARRVLAYSSARTQAATSSKAEKDSPPIPPRAAVNR